MALEHAADQTPAQPVNIGKLPPGEIDFHRRVNREFVNAQAAHAAWGRHLVERYQLKDGERIEEDGSVWKFPLPAAPDTAGAPEYHVDVQEDAVEQPTPINRHARRASQRKGASGATKPT